MTKIKKGLKATTTITIPLVVLDALLKTSPKLSSIKAKPKFSTLEEYLKTVAEQNFSKINNKILTKIINKMAKKFNASDLKTRKGYMLSVFFSLGDKYNIF